MNTDNSAAAMLKPSSENSLASSGGERNSIGQRMPYSSQHQTMKTVKNDKTDTNEEGEDQD